MMMHSLIMTAQMNDIDWQAWLTDLLAPIVDHPAQRLELVPGIGNLALVA